MRTGEHSQFSLTGMVDSFSQKTSADLITALDWNKLGDALYKAQEAAIQLKAREAEVKKNSSVRYWTGSFSPTWGVAVANQLSCTGKIVIPVSGCNLLGTYWPVQNAALVKVQTKRVISTDDDYRYQGSNITSAVWCPSNQFLDSNQSVYVQPPASYVNSAGSTISFATDFDPSDPDEFYRTIIVGLYMDGYPVPTNINSLGITCDVFIMLPG